MLISLTILFCCIDHPIHPPQRDSNPFLIDFLSDKGYIFKLVDGIFQVYKDEKSLEEDDPNYYPYPSRGAFVADFSLLCAMIANGPL